MSTVLAAELTRRQQASLIGRVSYHYTRDDIRGFIMFLAATCDLDSEEILDWSRKPEFGEQLEEYVHEWNRLTDAKRISFLKKSGNHITWLRKPSQIKVREDLTNASFPCSQIGASLYVTSDHTPVSQIVSFKSFVRTVADQGQVYSLDHLRNLVRIWESLKVETKIELAKMDPESLEIA